ncbi:CHAT domain-containing protein [Cytidiella melzeri]|nr:CHAT domain-containing protein [Cytidiella melzeri]
MRLRSQYRRSGVREDLDAAIAAWRRTVELTNDGDDLKPLALDVLGHFLSSRYESSGSVDDLEELVSVRRRAVDLTPDGHSEKSSRLNNLGSGFVARFERFGDLTELQEAISLNACAVEITPDDDPWKPFYLHNLAIMLRRRFEKLGNIGNLDDLHQAVATSARAVNLAPDNHSKKSSWLDSLGMALLERYQHAGIIEDLQEAAATLTLAVSITLDNHSDKRILLTHLGVVLEARFERLGSLEDLQEAVASSARAVELIPDDHPDKLSLLNNFASALRKKFERLGNVEDLQQAVAISTRTVEHTPDNHPSKPIYLTNLASVLKNRFELLGSLDDLQQAVEASARAADLAPDNHPEKPVWLNNIALSLHTRFEKFGNIDDLQEAVANLIRAVNLTPDNHPSKPRWLTSLGVVLQTRYEHLHSLDDVQEAVSITARAVELTPDDDPSKPLRLNNLGLAIQRRWMQTGRIEDLHEAVPAFTSAVDLTPDNHPSKPQWLSNLGFALQTRFMLLGSLQPEAALQPSGSPSEKMKAAMACVRLLSDYPQSSTHHTLLQAHERALDLVPQVVWLGHNISRRYQELVELGSLASGAAADAIAADEHVRALEWLESGRTIVWGQVLHLRTPLDDLRQQHPQLASDLDRVSQALQNVNVLNASEPSSPTLSLQAEAENHYNLAIEYDKLIAQIREHEGFESFLQPKKLAELIPACASGPVVVINVHESRCDALILQQPGTVVHVPLPDFSYERAQELHRQLLSMLKSEGLRASLRQASHTGGEHEVLRLPSAESVTNEDCEPISDILATLWTCVVQPVIDKLSLRGVNSTQALPHITWCPTGPLVFLPLHAAGIYSESRRSQTVMDFAVSSYAPTLGTLLKPPLRALSDTDSDSHLNILVVSQPCTPGHPPIPKAKEEAELVQSLFSEHSTALNEADGTVDAVLHAMDTHGWVHLACHGLQNSQDPTKSAFALHDGTLELSTLMTKSLPHAELAFLSACQTATGDEKLPEEAVHLAAGMLNAGYKSVVGTMWSINDICAPIVARIFYKVVLEQIAAGGELKPAYALHEATRRLRKMTRVGNVEKFVLWVPFVHFGL